MRLLRVYARAVRAPSPLYSFLETAGKCLSTDAYACVFISTSLKIGALDFTLAHDHSDLIQQITIPTMRNCDKSLSFEAP